MPMTLTIDETVAARLRAAAEARGEDVGHYASSLLGAALRAENEAVAPDGPGVRFVRPTSPPAWVAAIQPLNPPTDGTNGLHRLVGSWPGDEPDEVVEEALRRLEESDVP
jgi:hypothetical protein